MRVKVCGITRSEDLELCARFGVQAIGFNFFSGSSRCITADTACALARNSGPFLYRVGVFVNEPDADKIRWIARHAGLHALQFHGDEEPGFCANFHPYPVIRAFRVGSSFRLGQLESFRVAAFLLDGFKSGEFGGTGVLADWDTAAEAARRWTVVLSGGLQPANVGEGVRRVQPAAVDVCSGVESEPGQKDPAKLAAFLAALRGI